jgi:hypothetical protein
MVIPDCSAHHFVDILQRLYCIGRAMTVQRHSLIDARGRHCMLPFFKPTGRVLTVPQDKLPDRGTFPTGNALVFTGHSCSCFSTPATL